ncbi:hypothetical protein SFC02_10085 [Terribacillus goriensis]|uniref:hypothetical protein n=1 Tax=Terribacillus saccharophilus TaxID=361277 RepID=UPI00398398AA
MSEIKILKVTTNEELTKESFHFIRMIIYRTIIKELNIDLDLQAELMSPDFYQISKGENQNET